MDKILLNQKLADWDKACRYFAAPDILAQLSNEEKRAVDFLVNYWRDQEFNPAACEPHITVLKSSDKLHSSNREIIEHSKMLRGIAQTFYTKDAASFNIFRSALGWKPKQNNQTPTPEDSLPSKEAAASSGVMVLTVLSQPRSIYCCTVFVMMFLSFPSGHITELIYIIIPY